MSLWLINILDNCGTPFLSFVFRFDAAAFSIEGFRFHVADFMRECGGFLLPFLFSSFVCCFFMHFLLLYLLCHQSTNNSNNSYNTCINVTIVV